MNPSLWATFDTLPLPAQFWVACALMAAGWILVVALWRLSVICQTAPPGSLFPDGEEEPRAEWRSDRQDFREAMELAGLQAPRPARPDPVSPLVVAVIAHDYSRAIGPREVRVVPFLVRRARS